MQRKKRALVLAVLAAVMTTGPGWTLSYAAFVSTFYFGPGKFPRATELETVVGESLRAPTAICVFVGRNGRGKGNASVNTRITITRGGAAENLATTAGLVYRPAIGDSISCACANTQLAIGRGDRIHAAIRTRGFKRLSGTQEGVAELIALDGVPVPQGIDCSSLVP